MKDIEAIWHALEEWRERTAGDVYVESFGAGWLCRLQAPSRGIRPALCHGVDASTAVEGALAVLALRDTSSTERPSCRSVVRGRAPALEPDRRGRVPSFTVDTDPWEKAPDSRVTTRGAGAPGVPELGGDDGAPFESSKAMGALGEARAMGRPGALGEIGTFKRR